MVYVTLTIVMSVKVIIAYTSSIYGKRNYENGETY